MSVSRSQSRSFGIALLISGPLVFPLSASAQNSTDSAAAQGLFDQAKQLMASGKYLEACPKLEESQRLDPGSGTLLNLADCYEHTGRTATAWSKFLEAASAAQTAGKVDREKTAREHAAALVPRLAKFVIVVPDAPKIVGLEIHRDGQLVGNAQWGTPIPADQGEHLVTASAPGRRTWQTTVKLEGDGATATATVPNLEPGVDTSPVSATNVSRATSDTAASEANQPPPRPFTLGQRTIGFIVGGIGIASAVAGIVFELDFMSEKAKKQALCPNGCTPENLDHYDSLTNVETTNRALAIAGFSVGLAGIATGTVLVITSGSTSVPSSALRLHPVVGRRGGGIVLGTSW